MTYAATARAGRTLAIEDLAFDGFPNDHRLWWLRWVDYGAATGTSRSSFLHLLFSELRDETRADALPVLDAGLAARPCASHRSEAHIGWLPVLRIGLVVKAGKVVGELGAEVRHFRFEAPRHIDRVELLLHASPATVEFRRSSRRRIPTDDTSFEMGDRPGLLHPSDYPLPGVRDGRLLCFGSRHTPPSLLVPCTEVVRVAYAPHAALARAVIDHSWSRRMPRVLDLERSGPMADGAGWQLAPRVRLRADHIAVAANLALNPVAYRRANLIHYELMMAPAGVLTASLPFEWEVLELWVACIRLRTGIQDDRWLGYAVERLRWPPPPLGPPQSIRWVPGSRQSSGVDRHLGNGRTSEPSATDGEHRLRPRGRVVQDADPSLSASLDVVTEGADWIDTPDVIRAAKPLDIVRHGERKLTLPMRKRNKAEGQLAAAEPGRSKGGPIPVDPQVVRPGDAASRSSLLFEEVSAMLKGLVTSGELQESEMVAAEGADLEQRGNIAAWGFPHVVVPRKGLNDPKRRWYIRDFARERSPDGPRKHLRRAAMVCRLVDGSRVAYWIEIEPRGYGHDNYHSLVFSVTSLMPIEAVIWSLLEVAAERAGVWPDLGTLQQLVATEDKSGIRACSVWRHLRLDFSKPEKNSESVRHTPEGFGSLSPDAALVEIRKVLSG